MSEDDKKDQVEDILNRIAAPSRAKHLAEPLRLRLEQAWSGGLGSDFSLLKDDKERHEAF